MRASESDTWLAKMLHVLQKQKGLRQDTQTGSESQTGELKTTTQSLLHVLHKQKGIRQDTNRVRKPNWRTEKPQHNYYYMYCINRKE